jgi:hypothetical protein
MQHIGIPHRANVDEALEEASCGQWINRMCKDLALVFDMDDERQITLALNMSLWGWTAEQRDRFQDKAVTLEKQRRAHARATAKGAS